MYKRLILLILPILIITGCESEYNLSFVGDELNEEIVSTVSSSDIPKLTQDDINLGLELDDPVTPFIEMDQYPFEANEDIKYDKTVEKKGSDTVVTLKHSYSIEEYREGKALNTCFSNGEVVEDAENYYFSLSGKFYCMYSGDVAVNFTTDKKVVKHNADYVSDNTYTWIINNDNYKNVDINIQISNGAEEIKKRTTNIVLLVIGVITISFTLFFYLKFKNRQKVNQI